MTESYFWALFCKLLFAIAAITIVGGFTYAGLRDYQRMRGLERGISPAGVNCAFDAAQPVCITLAQQVK